MLALLAARSVMRAVASPNCIKLLDVHDTYRGRHLVMEYATKCVFSTEAGLCARDPTSQLVCASRCVCV